MAPGDKGLINRFFFPVGFGAIGFLTPTAYNYHNYRPALSGIHRHFALGVAGVIFGHYVEKLWQWRWSERDAQVQHYIELHPEDFVEHKRKYKEIFDEWYPMR